MAPSWRTSSLDPLGTLLYDDGCFEFHKNLKFHPPNYVGCNSSVIRLIWDRYCCSPNISCMPFNFGTYRAEKVSVTLIHHLQSCSPTNVVSTAFPDLVQIYTEVKVNKRWVQRSDYRAITLSCGFTPRRLAVRDCSGYSISTPVFLLYQQLYSYFNYVAVRTNGCGNFVVDRPFLLFGSYDLMSNDLFRLFQPVPEPPDPVW